MGIAARLDEMGKGAWIATMIVAFVVFWPLGLALLAYLIWSGRMGCRHYYWDESMKDDLRQRRDEMRDEWRARREEWHAMKRAWRDEMKARWHAHHRSAETSGNAAFDEYKAETLKRLEEEQAEFSDFLTNLRKARDKAEFDDFMASRKPAAKAETMPEPAPAPIESTTDGDRTNPGPYSA
ncbi:MAG: DUF2852 domain-containing protein [Alphaproteobacteria bacterium]|nr:DUF2852 domain-containing protein [Alphaproteobacteria bacterium]